MRKKSEKWKKVAQKFAKRQMFNVSLQRKEQKHGRLGGELAGRTVRHLWDYIRVRMAMNNPL